MVPMMTDSDKANPAGNAGAVSALHCDFYELTMAQGYWLHNNNPAVVFDMFIRANPFAGGYTIFAGLHPLLETLQNFRFSDDDIRYLRECGMFHADFLEYLRGFVFSGTIYAMDEGEIFFPHEPVLRVHANLIEAQIIEGIVLNIINFQSLIATKSSRICRAAGGGEVLEFGMRRAQGLDGALSASRAAYIGGVTATSHVAAAKRYGIPVSGTMAHSWVLAHVDEEDAFEKYAALYPDNVYLLIDTNDSLGSGIAAAIKIGKKIQQGLLGGGAGAGSPDGAAPIGNFGVRLDSGDIEYLSKRIRKRLDDAGLPQAKIAVSNDLSEEIIEYLRASNSPIDAWGVGTNLITGATDSALGGVYKLTAKRNNGIYQPLMKVANDPTKSTNPGIKQSYRFYDDDMFPQVDLVALVDEKIDTRGELIFNHPLLDYRKFRYTPTGACRQLLRKWYDNGKLVRPAPALSAIRRNCLKNINTVDDTYLRRINPHVYRVSISEQLRKVKEQIISTGGRS